MHHYYLFNFVANRVLRLEFFTFPAYMNNVAATTTCLQNLKDLTGTWPPLRIGGTTQFVNRILI
jgi:hypothetical protein